MKAVLLLSVLTITFGLVVGYSEFARRAHPEPNETNETDDLSKGCRGKNDVWYKVGTSFPARDGCNRCKCFRGASKEHPEGEAGCTRMGCGPWNGVKNVAAPRRVHPEPNETNETDDLNEGCRDVENDVWYNVGTSFPARDGCNSCYCVRGASKERPDGLARCTIEGCGP